MLISHRTQTFVCRGIKFNIYAFINIFLVVFELFIRMHGRSCLACFVSVFHNSLRHTHCSKKPTLILLFWLYLALNILPSIYFTLIIILCDSSQALPLVTFADIQQPFCTHIYIKPRTDFDLIFSDKDFQIFGYFSSFLS